VSPSESLVASPPLREATDVQRNCTSTLIQDSKPPPTSEYLLGVHHRGVRLLGLLKFWERLDETKAFDRRGHDLGGGSTRLVGQYPLVGFFRA
jgi:hypothetical protein